MIFVISDPDGKCDIIDHNKELENISVGKAGEEEGINFGKLRRSLKKNIQLISIPRTGRHFRNLPNMMFMWKPLKIRYIFPWSAD